METVAMSQKAGFVIHPQKLQLEPTTSIEYLGFNSDSLTMIVKLTVAKAIKL